VTSRLRPPAPIRSGAVRFRPGAPCSGLAPPLRVWFGGSPCADDIARLFKDIDGPSHRARTPSSFLSFLPAPLPLPSLHAPPTFSLFPAAPRPAPDFPGTCTRYRSPVSSSARPLPRSPAFLSCHLAALRVSPARLHSNTNRELQPCRPVITRCLSTMTLPSSVGLKQISAGGATGIIRSFDCSVRHLSHSSATGTTNYSS
jgi:hypothetical protein